jgi:hypothetical protein
MSDAPQTYRDIRLVVQSRTEKDDETGEPLYWNNKIGWVDKKNATRFMIDDTSTLHLPLGGMWIFLNKKQ